MTKPAVDVGSRDPDGSRRARLAEIVMVRVAAEPAAEREVLRDLATYAEAPGLSAMLKAELQLALAGLAASGHVDYAGNRLVATASGSGLAARVLGFGDGKPGDGWPTGGWPEVRDRQLVALALGRAGSAGATSQRRKAAERLDGLRALVVEAAFDIATAGRPSASRIRQRLAVMALERAFGNSIKGGLGGKTAMSAKASRALAGQLARRPRQHATDARLVAQLAAEATGVAKADLGQLRAAIVRKWLAKGSLRRELDTPAPSVRQPARRGSAAAGGEGPAEPPAGLPRGERTQGEGARGGVRPMAPAKPAAGAGAAATAGSSPAGTSTSAVSSVPPEAATAIVPPTVSRPAPAEFARAVQAAAASRAEGWTGNRRAFVSQVWAVVQERHARWGLSEIEFKSMLAEAHRMGLLALANADLKDRRNLADIEASAVSYKNTVWHYVRVEEANAG